MIFDFKFIQKFYCSFKYKLNKVRSIINRPMTYSEKILYTHLEKSDLNNLLTINKNNKDHYYLNFYPDRIAMQDATAQMTLLQFMQTNRNQTLIPTTIHCDHLIYAKYGSKLDLKNALKENEEIYNFLESASQKYGIGFWKAGSGIIHQIILENYAFPGGMIIGTDSHTPNSGGLGMLGIGVGGSDAAEVMAGSSLEIKYPKIIGVILEGKINSGWTTPKDIILKLLGILGVSKASNSIIEYIGNGTKNISCVGKSTICNMGAELGATSSLFPYDFHMMNYLNNSNRKKIALITQKIGNLFNPDKEVIENPYNFYDKVIKIDLSKLEPYINGPFTPDRSIPISNMKKESKKNSWPTKIEVGLIGSCTNSSYEDFSKVISIIHQVKKKKLNIKSEFLVSPGSKKIEIILKKKGLTKLLKAVGAKIFSNSCGPCIGQWNRSNYKNENNTIIHSFNRNFSSRNDGNPKTHAFIASPEIVTALTIAGNLNFDPRKDSLINQSGEMVKLEEPKHLDNYYNYNFNYEKLGYIKPLPPKNKIYIKIKNNSERLQLLKPFPKWNGKDISNIRLLIKIKGKCTTDHISMAGFWLRYRGNLEKISNNLLIKAKNFFNNQINRIKNPITGKYTTVPETARYFKLKNIDSVIVGEENYGEGSSREHAAMEPRFLGVRVVLVKSFSRIHETNLKKQGILALTFSDISDYYKIQEDDIFSFHVKDFDPKKNIKLEIVHKNGKQDMIITKHNYNEKQIQWFKSGSSLNFLKKNSL